MNPKNAREQTKVTFYETIKIISLNYLIRIVPVKQISCKKRLFNLNLSIMLICVKCSTIITQSFHLSPRPISLFIFNSAFCNLYPVEFCYADLHEGGIQQDEFAIVFLCSQTNLKSQPSQCYCIL
jgi:hypothetical protein